MSHSQMNPTAQSQQSGRVPRVHGHGQGQGRDRGQGGRRSNKSRSNNARQQHAAAHIDVQGPPNARRWPRRQQQQQQQNLHREHQHVVDQQKQQKQSDDSSRSQQWTRHRLTDATAVLVGQCETTCPISELETRRLHVLEWAPFPSSCTHSLPLELTRRLARDHGHECGLSREYVDQIEHIVPVSVYHRAAAGRVNHSEHVRPLNVLISSLTHLLSCLGQCHSMQKRYVFVCDRLRAIRSELTLQGLFEPIQGSKTTTTAIAILQSMIAFHATAIDELKQDSIDLFDPAMNDRMITDCFASLLPLYHVLDADAIACTEAVKQQVLQQRDRFICMFESMRFGSESISSLESLSTLNVDSSLTRQYLNLCLYLHNNDYVKFFSLVQSMDDYIGACLLIRHFDRLRINAIHRIDRVYMKKSKVPLAWVCPMIGLDSESNAVRLLTHLEGVALVNAAPDSTAVRTLDALPTHMTISRSTLSFRETSSDCFRLISRFHESIIASKRANFNLADLLTLVATVSNSTA